MYSFVFTTKQKPLGNVMVSVVGVGIVCFCEGVFEILVLNMAAT